MNHTSPISSPLHPSPVGAFASSQRSSSEQTRIDAPSSHFKTRKSDELDQAQRRTRATKILTDATRDFGRISRPSASQITQYKELFYQLIDRVGASDRRLISAMLARFAFTPRSVALYFSQDTTEIAAPFLLFSSVLGDRDLRAIAAKMGRKYADIILKRKLPMDDLTIKMLADPKPVVTVKSNTPILTTPVTKKVEDTWLSGDEILALASVGGKLGKTSAKNVASKRSSAVMSNDDTTPIRNNPDLPKRDVRSLMHLARTHDQNGFAALVEKISGLETDATLRLLSSQSGDELAYLINALGIPAPHNIQMLLVLAPRYGRDIEGYRALKKLLGDLDIGICRLIFNEIGAKFDLERPASLMPSQQNVSSSNEKNDFHRAVRDRRESVRDDSRYTISSDMYLQATG